MKRSYLQIAHTLLLILILLTSSFAQTPAAKKRKKLKHFGSSLERLKWDPEKNAARQLPAGVADSDDDVIRIDTSLVSCDLLVLDRQGNSVPGLTAGDFLIVEDGTPQTVGHFLKGDNVEVPRTIVLIFDYSGSQVPYLKTSVAAAKVLVDELGPKDLMAIVTDDVEMIQDYTADKKKLKSKLDQLAQRTQPGGPFFSAPVKHRLGQSKQYSALMATLNEAFQADDVRPIIIFQTDGDEAYYLRNSPIQLTLPSGLEGEALEYEKKLLVQHQELLLKSRTEFSLDDLYHTVERSRATVYTVVPGLKLLGLTPEAQLEKVTAQWRAMLAELRKQIPRDRLDKMKGLTEQQQRSQRINLAWQAQRVDKLQAALAGVAALTGGWTEYLETPEQAGAIYSRIFSDINQRYIVGYYPTNKEHDGTRRKIDFQVKGHPEYQIYGRRSYFAPGP